PTTRAVADELQLRCREVLKLASRVTVVYDRGCHSNELLTLFEPGQMSFVCGVGAGQYPDHLHTTQRKLKPVDGLDGHSAYRTKVTIDKRRYTLLCVRSQSFADKQLQGLHQTLAKAEHELAEIARI
ncbi:MAG: hypothetical protein LC790_11300, partial [Actinobacteria bacterium]|nr:hypothetical protein [Actinomycetota bacterium]